MKKLSLHGQVILGLAFGLFWGISFTLLNTKSISNQNEVEQVNQFEPFDSNQQQLFTTLPDMMMVRVRLFQNALPKIVRIISLLEGRLTISQGENWSLRVVSNENQTLYEVWFTPNFFYGDPPTEHDSVEMIFILPTIVEAYGLQLSTPYGDVFYEIN